MIKFILIVETRHSNKSDYMYIKSTLDYFYLPRSYAIKPIYAKSKSELINQDKKILAEKSSTSRKTEVIICADFDRPEQLNSDIENYCARNSYNLIWMNLNVEDVYWRKLVKDRDKKTEAENFQKKKDTLLPKLDNLNEEKPLLKKQSSNILNIFDKYIKRK